MKTIYKVNGRSFNTAWEAKFYMDCALFIEIDREEFVHDGTRVICINVAQGQAR